jgi:predicted PurR-regulated permease PerM
MSNLSSRTLGFAIIVAAAVIVLIWGIRGLAGILNPILLAAVITVTLLPVPVALEKRGLKSGPALLVTILLVVLVIVGLTWLVLASVAQVNEGIPSYSESFEDQNETSDPDAGALEDAVQSIMQTVNKDQYSDFLTSFLSIVATAVSQLFLTLLIFIFMLYTALSLPDLSRLGISSQSDAVGRAIGLTGDVRRYMGLTAFINLLVGTADAILLWYFDVPYAALWGVLAFILGFIPAVGYWIALIPPVLLTYSLYGTQTALIIFVLYAVINGIAANIISPRVLGKGLSISPLIVFVSVFVWGWLLGAIGAILAIPLTMLIITILDSFPTTTWVARLMSYVPGSEKVEDVAAVDHAKGVLARLRERIPSSESDESRAPLDSAPGSEL